MYKAEVYLICNPSQGGRDKEASICTYRLTNLCEKTTCSDALLILSQSSLKKTATLRRMSS